VSHNVLWYTARGTGATLLMVLTLTVVIGIVARSGRPFGGLPGFAVAHVHRNVSLLALALLVLHVTTLVLDPVAHIGVLDAVIPFGAGYRPLWVGLGTCAADILLALVITSLLRHRIGVRLWRGLHWAAYAAWPVAFFHALGSGTDIGATWLRLVAAGCALAVVVAAGWRASASFLPAGRTSLAASRAQGIAPSPPPRSFASPPDSPPPARQRSSQTHQPSRPRRDGAPARTHGEEWTSR
jgi:sulfoxide reductase heme-binding subunit YedZ